MNSESKDDVKMKKGFPGTTSVRHLLLSILVLIICLLYMLLPGNQKWLNNRIFPYFNDLHKQLQNQNLEYRRAARYDRYYTYTKRISDEYQKLKDTLAIDLRLLVPTSQYFKRNGIQYDVPDPVTFYYFSGVKIVNGNNPDSLSANCFLQIKDKVFSIKGFQNNSERSDSLVAFRQ